MNFTPENIFLLGSVLVLASIFISKTGARFGVPVLLLFLFTGMLFGSDGLGLQFDNPETAQLIGMFSLSVILFSGGMDTRMTDVKPIASMGVVLSTVGVLLTTLITGVFAYYISITLGVSQEMSLTLAMLMAATMSSTDSASVFNILRSQGIGLKYKLRHILELESGSNDPMAYMLTIALMNVILTGEDLSVMSILGDLAMQFTVGACLGCVFGYLSTLVVNKINLSNGSLYPVLLLSMVMITFHLTDMFNGNGYLAVYVAGVVVGNKKQLSYRKEMVTFMQGLTHLMQIVLFLMLGLLVNPAELIDVALFASAVGVFMIVVARPASVFLSLLPFRHYPAKAKLLLSWVGLRGAVPIIFATYPMIAGIKGADFIFNVVFFVTILSLVVQGTSISYVARKLHLDAPDDEEQDLFGIEIPDELNSKLTQVTLTRKMVDGARVLSELKLPEGVLVVMIKRGDSTIVPNGQVVLKEGDVLLMLSSL